MARGVDSMSRWRSRDGRGCCCSMNRWPGLSTPERVAMRGLLEQLDPSIAVLLIEHDMDVAFSFAARVTVLHQGRVLADGTRDEVSANDLVQQAYLGAVGSRQFTFTVHSSGRCSISSTSTRTTATATCCREPTLRAERGKVTAVLGRNGVGKTTLCRSLTGLTPARRGRVLLDGSTSRGCRRIVSATQASAWFRRAGASSSR